MSYGKPSKRRRTLPPTPPFLARSTGQSNQSMRETEREGRPRVALATHQRGPHTHHSTTTSVKTTEPVLRKTVLSSTFSTHHTAESRPTSGGVTNTSDTGSRAHGLTYVMQSPSFIYHAAKMFTGAMPALRGI